MQDNSSPSFKLEELSKVKLLIVYIVFFVLFFVNVMIGYAGPTPTNYLTQEYTNNLTEIAKEVMTGQVPIRQTLTGLDRLNYNFAFKVILSHASSSIQGFSKDDVLFNVSVYAKNREDVSWTLLRSPDLIGKRTLTCEQGANECEAITIAEETYIEWEQYLTEAYVTNMQPFADQFSKIQTQYQYTNKGFRQFELAFRYIYCILAIVMCALYITITFLTTKEGWQSEQKWTAILLCALIAYNNPFYAADILTDAWGWFFPFLDVVFVVSYIAALLLCLLVFTHAAYKPKEDRTFRNFYLMKLIVITAIWIIAIAAFFWWRWQGKDDPTNTEVEHIPGFVALRIILALLLGAYLFLLIFYIVRAASKLSKRSFPRRFIYLWALTILVILATIAGVLALQTGPIQNSSIQFLSFWALYNLYTYVLAFLFLPAQTAKPMSRLEETQQ